VHRPKVSTGLAQAVGCEPHRPRRHASCPLRWPSPSSIPTLAGLPRRPPDPALVGRSRHRSSPLPASLSPRPMQQLHLRLQLLTMMVVAPPPPLAIDACCTELHQRRPPANQHRLNVDVAKNFTVAKSNYGCSKTPSPHSREVTAPPYMDVAKSYYGCSKKIAIVAVNQHRRGWM